MMSTRLKSFCPCRALSPVRLSPATARASIAPIHGLEIIGADVPVPFKQAVTLGKRGRPKKGEGKGSPTTISGRGVAYLEARLRRDHPEILAAKAQALIQRSGDRFLASFSARLAASSPERARGPFGPSAVSPPFDLAVASGPLGPISRPTL